MKTPPRVLGLALALSLALPLTGCGSMLERSYASVTPHTQFYDESAITSTLGAENYQGLVSALLHLVERRMNGPRDYELADPASIPELKAIAAESDREKAEMQKEAVR